MFLFYGSKVAYPLSLYAVSVLLAQGDPLVVVDGGNAFDPYVISDAARRLDQSPEELLSRVHISRAFTCHQLEALITGRLENALRRFRSRSLMLSGLLDTLYDEDVSHGEALGLFRRIVATLRVLRSQGVSMVALCPETSAPLRQRRIFLSELQSEADRVIRAETEDGRILLTTEKPEGLEDPRHLITDDIAPGRRWR
ncbi:hypothetical protein MYX64_08495 [Nitrospinae bacterium AH_259_B05_G02_I21]|nr:hypothetical protein [Nitrospinae bacterium AH_259_B05_G02_I21]MDA2932426.1 hypothetical protein [Nitrospinae bacterium AH-259-F20]